MKFNQALNNFSAGEWSPKMKGRTDVQQYANACETLENFIPQIHGGVTRRPPTNKVPLLAAYTSDLAAASGYKLITRYLSNGTNEILVSMNTTPSTTWFVVSGPTSSGRVIVTVDTAASIGTGADQASLPTSYVQIGDLVFMTQATTGVGTIPRVWSGVSASDRLSNINQFIVTNGTTSHGNYMSVPYLPPVANVGVSGITAPVITVGGFIALGGLCTLNASAAFFDTGHLGSYIKFSSGGSTGVVRITSVTNSTVAGGIVVVAVPSLGAYGATAGTSYEEAAWSDYRGWPRTVTAYQGRLIFGGTKTYPDTIWGSRIGNVFDFMERPLEQDSSFSGYEDDNSRPFTLTPSSGEVGYIVGLSAAKTLLIHTNKNEIVAYGTNGALGPNDVSFEASTSFGSSDVQPIRTNSYAAFVDRTGRKIRDVNFNFEEGQYTSSDLTFLADHLTIDKIPEDQRTGLLTPAETIDPIKEIVNLTQGTTYIICRTNKNKLLGLALDKEYKINAWFRINIAGKHPVISDDRDFAPVYAIGSLNTQFGDELYIVTGRKINGSTIVRLERMLLPSELSEVSTADFSSYPEILGPFHCDYMSTGATVAGDTTISAGTDFAGEEVELFLDKAYIGRKAVSNAGIITLDSAIEANGTYIIGFPYKSTLKVFPIELGQQIPGSPQGLIKRIDQLTIRFLNTFGAKYGYKESELTSINFRDPTSIDADPVKFFTGTKVISMAANYTQDAQAIVVQDKPWPCNILCITARGVLND